MVSLLDLLEILKFQLRRDIFYLMKLSLDLIEKDREALAKLELLLNHAGFEDKELFKSEQNFKEARKKILDEHNSRIKEIDSLINKFNIKIDKTLI